MKNNEIYNIVKINNLALSAITPKILDALLELDEDCKLDIETITLDITIKCQDVQITSKYCSSRWTFSFFKSSNSETRTPLYRSINTI